MDQWEAPTARNTPVRKKVAADVPDSWDAIEDDDEDDDNDEPVAAAGDAAPPVKDDDPNAILWRRAQA